MIACIGDMVMAICISSSSSSSSLTAKAIPSRREAHTRLKSARARGGRVRPLVQGCGLRNAEKEGEGERGRGRERERGGSEGEIERVLGYCDSINAAPVSGCNDMPLVLLL